MQFQRSQEWHERARRVIPGGISSNVRKNWLPCPLFYTRGCGARVWDVDGNEFVDYVLARGPLLLGHSPRRVLDAVKAQLDVGLMYAGQCPLEVEAAEAVCRIVPCAEMVRFSNSGSEAVHGAWRLARAVTGRPKILRFEGHYHGWFDPQVWSMAPPLETAGPAEAPCAVATSGGVAASGADEVIVLPWNDADLLERTLAARHQEIALVCTEPLMCNNGCLVPRPGYLEAMRALCDRYGILLMFDEVITGFRLAPGGAQERFGVTPDLATFAKGIASGFTVSAIAGKRELMERYGDLSVLHAGTYNANAPCMAAVVASLSILTEDDGRALREIERQGTRLIAGIRAAGARHGQPVAVRGFGAAFSVTFGHEVEPTEYRSFLRRDLEKQKRWFSLLQEEGVRTTPDQLWFVSAAHTDHDIDQTLAAIEKAMGSL